MNTLNMNTVNDAFDSFFKAETGDTTDLQAALALYDAVGTDYDKIVGSSDIIVVRKTCGTMDRYTLCGNLIPA